MQQIINTGRCRVLCIALPLLQEDGFEIRGRTGRNSLLSFFGQADAIELPPGSWQILAMAKDVTEEMAKQVCQGWGDESYTNYLNQIEVGSCYSAKLSFSSLCTSHNIQHNDLILIEKD